MWAWRVVILRPVLAWMDLEMTGLDPSRHVILEIAVLVTDDDLNLVAAGPDLVIHQPEEALELMGDVVQKMHTRSGLIDQVRASTISLSQAGKQVLEFLQENLSEDDPVPLCGNTIETDRRFLARYLPEIDNYLHYRSIDVSSIKELARRWHPDTYKQAPKKANSHRALDDITESVNELRWYRTAGFIGGNRPADASQTPN